MALTQRRTTARTRREHPRHTLPLAGVRVIDLGQAIAIPYAGQMLAWMGAEVILVETRSRLGQRNSQPKVPGMAGLDSSAAFNTINSGTRSITVNIKQKRGLDLLRDLARVSDVVMDNFATGTMERLGLGYQDLRQMRPDIIVLSLAAFGRTGPLKDAVGLHSTVNLFSGLADVTGYPGGHPRIAGAYLPDFLSGIHCITAIMAALHHRRRSGRGRYIELAMTEVLTSLIPEAVIDYTLNGRLPERRGSRHPVHAPHNVYRCLGDDAWVAIAVTTDQEWAALCQATGHPEWRDDPRFAVAVSRRNRQDELDPLIEQWTRQRTKWEAMEVLQAAGVPAGATYNGFDVLQDEHMGQRGFIVAPDHPVVGKRPMAGLPWRVAEGSPAADYRPAPLLGEGNEYVLCDLLGVSRAELAAFEVEKVLY